MRILIVGEGKHELGVGDALGALSVLVSRLTKTFDIEARPMNDVRVRTHAGRGHRFEKRAIAWMRQAEREGFDALVIVVDEDGDRERAPALSRAQADPVCHIQRAAGVAIRTFDAWMLADPKVLSAVLGRPIDTQPLPETIDNPKETFESLTQDRLRPEALHEVYRRIAEQVDLTGLAQRCPKGFGVFAARVRALNN